MWLEGEPYEFKPDPISWEDYQIIVPALYAQYRANKLKYEDYCDIIQYGMRLKSIP